MLKEYYQHFLSTTAAVEHYLKIDGVSSPSGCVMGELTPLHCGCVIRLQQKIRKAIKGIKLAYQAARQNFIRRSNRHKCMQYHNLLLVRLRPMVNKRLLSYESFHYR